MLNSITIMGRLTRDPELRKTGTGISVASFTIACDRDIVDKNTNERETDFIDCVAWRGLGDMVAKYFTKGRMAVVKGRLETRKWTDKSGNKRYNVEVIAEDVYFGDSKPQNAGPAAAGYSAPVAPVAPVAPGAAAPATSCPSIPESDFAMLDDDDAQLPF